MKEKKEEKENDFDKLISIILPTFNSEKTINKAIQSIYEQNVRNNLEIIIVDDYSTDSTIDAIKKYKNTNKVKLELIQNEMNMGTGFSRKLGLSKAKGYFIAFLDSDDYWLKDKLNKQLSFLKKNCNVDFVYSDFLKELKKNDKTYHFHLKMPNYVSAKTNKYKNHIPNSSVLIKSKTIKNTNYPTIRTRNDFLYWNRILLKNKKIKAFNSNPDTPLFVYSQYPGISKRKFNLIKDQWILYRNYLNYSLLESAYGIIVNLIFTIIKKIKISSYLLLQK